MTRTFFSLLVEKLALIAFSLLLLALLVEIGFRLAGAALTVQQLVNSRPPANDKNAYRVLCLGESTTARGYPNTLGSVLNKECAPKRFTVINGGVNGTNTANIVHNLPANLKKHKPDMVIVMMGVNDGHDTVSFSDDLLSKTALLGKNLRIYKLARLLRERFAHLLAELGVACVRCGMRHAWAGSPKKAACWFRWSIRLDAHNYQAYCQLIRLYRADRRYPAAERIFKDLCKHTDIGEYPPLQPLVATYGCPPNSSSDACEQEIKKTIKINPHNYAAYTSLAKYYRSKRRYAECEKAHLRALRINPKDDSSHSYLVTRYFSKHMWDEARRMYEGMIYRFPHFDRGYNGLALCYLAQNKHREADLFFKRAARVRLRYFNAATYHNYNALKNAILAKNIKLLCMQYPLRDIASLKRLLNDDDRVVYVDNERIFKNALTTNAFDKLFCDRFAGDFGHTTPFGDRLLCNNLSRIISSMLNLTSRSNKGAYQ